MKMYPVLEARRKGREGQKRGDRIQQRGGNINTNNTERNRIQSMDHETQRILKKLPDHKIYCARLADGATTRHLCFCNTISRSGAGKYFWGIIIAVK